MACLDLRLLGAGIDILCIYIYIYKFQFINKKYIIYIGCNYLVYYMRKIYCKMEYVHPMYF